MQPVEAPRKLIQLTIDGTAVKVPEGSSLLDACDRQGCDTPTMCYAKGLTPVNACRACVVEVEGSRALVPSCARPAEEGMVVATDSPRVRHSRKLVLELLGSSADISRGSDELRGWLKAYDADPARLTPDADQPVTTMYQEPKVEDDLYVRDYARCILCYKCVEACGDDAQHTFAIAMAGRGSTNRISTEFDAVLPDSACVYCGNCIGVCPTGALVFKTEHDRREAGTWNEAEQTVTQTICSYCGVGCTLELHVQDNEIVKVTSPMDHDVTNGHLCVKGRFGWGYV